MDFNEAVKAHSQWKFKLARYISNPDGSLKVSGIEPDNKCELGTWVHASGVKYAAHPEFQELKAEHAKFHKCAASIVSRADKGEKLEDELNLGGTSEYSVQSAAVIKLIMKMKTLVG
jgi:hypothetical protein